MEEPRHRVDRGRSETGWKVGEVKKVKKVKEKLGEGERQGGAQGWRRGGCLFLNYQVAESFTVQKVLTAP